MMLRRGGAAGNEDGQFMFCGQTVTDELAGWQAGRWRGVAMMLDVMVVNVGGDVRDLQRLLDVLISFAGFAGFAVVSRRPFVLGGIAGWSPSDKPSSWASSVFAAFERFFLLDGIVSVVEAGLNCDECGFRAEV
jgi:hypothetical protein